MDNYEQTIADGIKEKLPQIDLPEPDDIRFHFGKIQTWNREIIIPYDASRPRDEIYSIRVLITMRKKQFDVTVDDSDGKQAGLFTSRLIDEAINSLSRAGQA